MVMEMAEQVKHDELVRALKSVFESGALVSPETHENHHRWIHDKVKAEQKCEERRDKLFQHVLGWLAVGALEAATLIGVGRAVVILA